MFMDRLRSLEFQEKIKTALHTGAIKGQKRLDTCD